MGTLADKLDEDAEEAAHGSAFARRQRRTKKYQDFHMVRVRIRVYFHRSYHVRDVRCLERITG